MSVKVNNVWLYALELILLGKYVFLVGKIIDT